MIYTGIGSRKTPDDILHNMCVIAIFLSRIGLTLRSGAAPGADAAFEKGCLLAEGEKEIYLPWKNFQKHTSELYNVCDGAMEIAAEFHHAWQYLKRPVKLLMARNVYQVLGINLDQPSDFVLCWTPDGCISREERTKTTGGTGQAIAIASEHNIPVFNLQREHAYDDFKEFIAEKVEL